MCRLFGVTSGSTPAHATYWLMEAPDSLDAQSVANHDGCGIGWFDAGGTPYVEKSGRAAHDDRAFLTRARELESTTCVAHVRYATSGAPRAANSHPFELDGRLFAHNGAIRDVARVEQHLGADMATVRGDTDSERLFALVTREIRACGDVEEGLVTALRWVDANVPVVSLNLLLATPHVLYAVRYPETDSLYLLRAGAGSGDGEHRSSLTTRISLDGDAPSVVVASEAMDDEGWEEVPSGTLLRVGADLEVHSRRILG